MLNKNPGSTNVMQIGWTGKYGQETLDIK